MGKAKRRDGVPLEMIVRHWVAIAAGSLPGTRQGDLRQEVQGLPANPECSGKEQFGFPEAAAHLLMRDGPRQSLTRKQLLSLQPLLQMADCRC